jgi:hypothetical protein
MVTTRRTHALSQLTNARNVIAQKMIDMLEGVAFNNSSIDKVQAERLIIEADALIASVHQRKAGWPACGAPRAGLRQRQFDYRATKSLVSLLLCCGFSWNPASPHIGGLPIIYTEAMASRFGR